MLTCKLAMSSPEFEKSIQSVRENSSILTIDFQVNSSKSAADIPRGFNFVTKGRKLFLDYPLGTVEILPTLSESSKNEDTAAKPTKTKSKTAKEQSPRASSTKKNSGAKTAKQQKSGGSTSGPSRRSTPTSSPPRDKPKTKSKTGKGKPS